jgi:hypothetical protein
MQVGHCQIGSSSRAAAAYPGPAEDVADNGPARRQGLFDLAEHPISVKLVDGAVALGIQEPSVKIQQQLTFAAGNRIAEGEEKRRRRRDQMELGCKIVHAALPRPPSGWHPHRASLTRAYDQPPYYLDKRRLFRSAASERGNPARPHRMQRTFRDLAHARFL